MAAIGIISGSFDPITNGHAWLIREAAQLCDELHVVMAENTEKKYFFSSKERIALVNEVVSDLHLGLPATIHTISGVLLVDFAKNIGANRIIRGIRDTKDFEYERNMAAINRSIEPEIQTVFVVPPAELTSLSSSAVRGLIRVSGWERVVGNQVHPSVLTALRARV